MWFHSLPTGVVHVINNVYCTTADNKTDYICIYLSKSTAFGNYNKKNSYEQFRDLLILGIAMTSQTYFNDVTNIFQ